MALNYNSIKKISLVAMTDNIFVARYKHTKDNQLNIPGLLFIYEQIGRSF